MKILVIRFSSFGDIAQALSLSKKLKQHLPQHELHWLSRRDFHELIALDPHIDRHWWINRGSGLKDLLKLTLQLRKEQFSHVYDAHNSLRSRLICFLLNFQICFWKTQFLRKPRRSLRRFFLFQMGLNFFEQPFSGQRDLLAPLKKWGISTSLPPPPILVVNQTLAKNLREKFDFLNLPFIALAPSSAHPLKRWPIEHWKKLILSSPHQRFVLLGGKEDHFLNELETSDRVLNLAGRCSFSESTAIVQASSLLIANDTGVLHLAEQLGHPAIALMGPAPFGFPSRSSTRVLERLLPCRPCSKHGQKPCVNPEFHACLKRISPEEVRSHMLEMIG